MLSKNLLVNHFERFDELLQDETIAQKSVKHSLSSKFTTAQRDYVIPEPKNGRQNSEAAIRHRWRNRYVSLLQQVNTSSCSDVQPDIQPDQEPLSEWQLRGRIVGYLAILEGFMDKLEHNLQRNLALQIETEIGMAFVNQAEKFCLMPVPQPDEHPHSPCRFSVAVILMGVVLERLLRALCQGDVPALPISLQGGEYEQLNRLVNSLEHKGILNSMIAQQICFWLSLREKALLNQPELLDPADVKNMICGTREFLETIVKPSLVKG